MSLIEVWRDRKRGGYGPTKPPRLWKLLAAFVLVTWILLRLSGMV